MDTEIISYVVEEMFEPYLIAWYQANQSHIDGLTLNAYLLELSQLVLERNWVHNILKTILSSSQGNRVFIDWKIEMENLNTILATLAPAQALTKVQLKVQLQSNLHPDLRLNLSLKPVLATDLAAWAFEVKEQDDHMQAEDAHTQKLIPTSMAAHAVCCSEKKDLLSRLTYPPSSSSTPSMGKSKMTTKLHCSREKWVKVGSLFGLSKLQGMDMGGP